MQPPAYADKNPLKYGTNLKSGTGFYPKNIEAGRRLREWKDFPKPATRWTLVRV